MAGEAGAIDFRRREFRGIADIESGERFDVIAAGAVTRLADFAFKVFAFEAGSAIGIYDPVRTLEKRFGSVFVAHTAGFGADVSSGLG
jgi:hypothetical protein